MQFFSTTSVGSGLSNCKKRDFCNANFAKKIVKGGFRSSFNNHDCSRTASQDPGHTTRAPPVGFDLETNDIQFLIMQTC